MHVNKKLTDDDMKMLNKHMVNRIAGLLEEIHDKEWYRISSVMRYYALMSEGWDAAIPDRRDFGLDDV